MKTAIATSMLAILILNAPIAVSAENPTPKPSAGTPAAMGMMDDKQMVQMQDNFKSMQQQMDKLRQTKSPNDRQKLMQEHMQTMQANMQMMRGMGGPMMRGAMMGGQGGGMGQGGMGGSAMPNMDPKQRQDIMEKRMDMMQMMMEQMVQHDQMMQGMPAK